MQSRVFLFLLNILTRLVILTNPRLRGLLARRETTLTVVASTTTSTATMARSGSFAVVPAATPLRREVTMAYALPRPTLCTALFAFTSTPAFLPPLTGFLPHTLAVSWAIALARLSKILRLGTQTIATDTATREFCILILPGRRGLISSGAMRLCFDTRTHFSG